MQAERRASSSGTDPQAQRHAAPPALGSSVIWDGIVGFWQRRRGTILRTTLAVTAVGLILLLLWPSYYKATTLIALKPQPVVQGQPPPYTSEQRIQVEMQAVQAYDVLARVVEAQQLDEKAEFNPNLRDGEGFLGKLAAVASLAVDALLGTIKPTPAEEAGLRRRLVVGKVASRLSVIPVRTADVLEVTFASKDPRLAYTVANAIADTYIGLSLARRAEALQSTADALLKRIEIVQDELRNLPASGAATNTVERQLDARRTLLQTYITKLGDVLLQKAALEPHALIQSAAVLPLTKSGVSFVQVVPLLLVGGLLLGVGIGVAREALQRTITDNGQIEALFGLRVFGRAPAHDRAAPARPPKGVPERQISDFEKTCHEICLELLMRGRGRRNFVVAFTAPARGEDVTQIALGVGRGLADAGHPTLLVEAQPASPASAAKGRVPPADAKAVKIGETTTIIRSDAASSLAILPTSFDRASAPADYERVAHSVSALADQHEFVLLALPALSTAPGPRFLAASANTAVIVLRLGAARMALAAALDQIASLGLPVLGAALITETATAISAELQPKTLPAAPRATRALRRLRSLIHA